MNFSTHRDKVELARHNNISAAAEPQTHHLVLYGVSENESTLDRLAHSVMKRPDDLLVVLNKRGKGIGITEEKNVQ